ncbi:HTH domain-containing protein [Sorangium sp. So ce291]|uniref:HTH domain-containing protein n=1 Tax=Sorangium sp. So ce291 TaxID=3133294 RepID=UPI003F60AC18
MSAPLTFLEAAAMVLGEHGGPLSAREIWSEIQARRLCSTKGKTPEATLSTELQRASLGSPLGSARQEKTFYKDGPGTFGLLKWLDEGQRRSLEEQSIAELVSGRDPGAPQLAIEGTPARVRSFPTVDEILARYDASDQARSDALHNLHVWRRIQGGLAMAQEHPVSFDPWQKYWFCFERRVLVAYFADRFEQRYAPADALRKLAFHVFRHFDAAREANRFGEPIRAAEQPANWRFLTEAMAEVADGLGASSEQYLQLRTVWPRLKAASIRDDLSDYIASSLAEVEDLGAIEPAFFKRLPWFPYLGLKSIAHLRERQMFFAGYYLLFTSTNSYRRGGSISFAPVLQNNPTDVLLDYVKRWASGEPPARTGFDVQGRSERKDRSDHAPVLELFGFLNLHRVPFYNYWNASAYDGAARPGDTSVLDRMVRVGAATRTDLIRRPEVVARLAADFRRLAAEPETSPTIVMEGIARQSVARRHPEDEALLVDHEIRRRVEAAGRARAASMNDIEAASSMLHLMLDAYVMAERMEAHVVEFGTLEEPQVEPFSPTDSAPQTIVESDGEVASRPSTPPVTEALLHLPSALHGVGNDALGYLRAGFHVLLAGAPGTGKTTLAQFIAHAWNNDLPLIRGEISLEDAPLTTVGNSAWAPFHTIGGIIPDGRGGFAAHRGIFIDPAGSGGDDWQLRPECIVLDEMNRADLDRCIGELYPLLSRSVARVYPAGIAGVRCIRMHERFRVVATVNDATLDDIVFPISEGLARRFIRIELAGATQDDVAAFLSEAASLKERWDAAGSSIEQFFELCKEHGKLVTSDLGDHLPFGAGYFRPLREWIHGRLSMSPDFSAKDLEDQATLLLVTSIMTAVRVRGFDQVLKKLRSIEDIA